FAAGHEEGMASAVDTFKKKQALLEGVLLKAEAQLNEWLEATAGQALDLAKGAVAAFLGEQAVDAAMLQNIIQRMTAGLREAEVLAIRLYPVECQMLKSALKQANGAASRIADKLVEDAALEVGGVVVDTPRGEYRATLDVQLRKLMALLGEQ